MLDNTCNAPFLSCTADWHDLVNHRISFSKANLHPKLPVFWSLGISNCSTLARDTTSKKNSAVNQTELKPSNIQEFWCLILLSAAQHCAPQACSAWRRGTQASLSTDNSLSTAAWVSLPVNLLSSSTQPNVEALVRNWASRATLQVLSAGGPVPSARPSAPHSYRLFPSFKWLSGVLQRDDRDAVFGFAHSNHQQHNSFLFDLPNPFSQCISATFTGIW